MATLRAFVALELPETATTALATVQRDLRAAAARRGLDLGTAVKWVDPKGIHLTLKFLGYVDEDLVPALMDAVTAAAAGQAACRLQLSGVGAFPNPRQPRVVWAGMVGDVELVRGLQETVEEHLAPFGFAPEGRPFSPHLTLARLRETASPAERRAVAEVLGGGPAVPRVTFLADRLSLMKSDLHPSGARYTPLHTVLLFPRPE